MKKLLIVLILSLSFLSCFTDVVENSQGFIVATNVHKDEAAISWIFKGFTSDVDFFTVNLKDNNYEDVKYKLYYHTEYYNPPSHKNIRLIKHEEAILVDDITSPCILKGLESGKTYYIELQAYMEGDSPNNEGISDVFEVKVP